MKADLTSHTSRPLAGQFLELADHVLAMTNIHRDSLIMLHPRCEPVTRLLCGTADLPDPINSDLSVYRTCAKTMEKHIRKLVDDMMTIGAPVYEPSPDEERQ
jgi:protein-tyrosine phosphatase